MKTGVLWAGTMRRDCTIEERIEAASAAGFEALSLSPGDHAALDGDSARVRDVRRAAADLGVALPIMDSVTAWYPFDTSRPSRMKATSVEAALDAAEAFGCARLSAVGAFPAPLDTDGFAEHFALLCDAGRERGVAIQLEFGPVPPINGLAMGWEIVRKAGRENGGLVFDTWHFFRGTPDLDLLETIPGARITGVQLADGAKDIKESQMKDMMVHRLLPGEGVFDLAGVIATLRRTGGLNDVGPEVLSYEQHSLTPAQAAQRAAAAMAGLMATQEAR